MGNYFVELIGGFKLLFKVLLMNKNFYLGFAIPLTFFVFGLVFFSVWKYLLLKWFDENIEFNKITCINFGIISSLIASSMVLTYINYGNISLYHHSKFIFYLPIYLVLIAVIDWALIHILYTSEVIK